MKFGGLGWPPRQGLASSRVPEGFSHFVTSMTAPVASGWTVVSFMISPPFGTADISQPSCRSRAASPLKGPKSSGRCRRINPERQPPTLLPKSTSKTAVNPANTARLVQTR